MKRTRNAADEKTSSTLSDMILGWEGEDFIEVEVRFDWDILGVFEPGSTSGVDATPTEVWRPETHVVVLKDSASHNNFMATTCEEYLTRCWGSVWSQTLLEMLD